MHQERQAENSGTSAAPVTEPQAQSGRGAPSRDAQHQAGFSGRASDAGGRLGLGGRTPRRPGPRVHAASWAGRGIPSDLSSFVIT